MKIRFSFWIFSYIKTMKMSRQVKENQTNSYLNFYSNYKLKLITEIG